MLLMIDNYDSFTYNLVQYFQMLDQEVVTIRNDKISVTDALALNPQAIVISPGPGTPATAGISIELIKAVSGKLPLLGVCLGHQSIGEAFGGKIIKAQKLMHGKVSLVEHDGKGLYAGISSPLKATRYHSLAIERESFPESLEITARAEDGEIMGIQHREHLTVGMQYHPESVLTPAGKRILLNFLKMAGLK